MVYVVSRTSWLVYDVPELGNDINHTIFGSFTSLDDADGTRKSDSSEDVGGTSVSLDVVRTLVTSIWRKCRLVLVVVVAPTVVEILSNKLLCDTMAIPSIRSTEITIKIKPNCKCWLRNITLLLLLLLLLPLLVAAFMEDDGDWGILDLIVQDRLRVVGIVDVKVMVFVVAVIFPQRQLNIDWMRWGVFAMDRTGAFVDLSLYLSLSLLVC